MDMINEVEEASIGLSLVFISLVKSPSAFRNKLKSIRLEDVVSRYDWMNFESLPEGFQECVFPQNIEQDESGFFSFREDEALTGKLASAITIYNCIWWKLPILWMWWTKQCVGEFMVKVAWNFWKVTQRRAKSQYVYLVDDGVSH